MVKAEADIPKTIQRLMDLTNQARFRQNHLSLQGNAMLHWVAHLHSANMSKQHRCAQILQDGWTPSQRLTAAGYYHVLHGQHVDYRQELDADAIFDDWMQSPVYRAGILFRYEEMGIGIVQSPRGGYFITQMFGTRPRW